mmetsp:Transcript_3473/g.12524  ORF Transcript_3473/g.12524 Transcript_3473/m.12524 type:complete len:400 (-) Transcript_3473:199-1398(-)
MSTVVRSVGQRLLRAGAASWPREGRRAYQVIGTFGVTPTGPAPSAAPLDVSSRPMEAAGATATGPHAAPASVSVGDPGPSLLLHELRTGPLQQPQHQPPLQQPPPQHAQQQQQQRSAEAGLGDTGGYAGAGGIPDASSIPRSGGGPSIGTSGDGSSISYSEAPVFRDAHAHRHTGQAQAQAQERVHEGGSAVARALRAPPPPRGAEASGVAYIDTLSLHNELLQSGLSPAAAETLTLTLHTALQRSFAQMLQTLVTRAEVQALESQQAAETLLFKTEVQSRQEHEVVNLKAENERMRVELEKLRGELRYELDKLTASQRLDTNLEKGRLREMMQLERDRSLELHQQTERTLNAAQQRLDQEVHLLKTHLEATKNDVIKYCIGTVVSMLAVGLGFARLIF